MPDNRSGGQMAISRVDLAPDVKLISPQAEAEHRQTRHVRQPRRTYMTDKDVCVATSMC